MQIETINYTEDELIKNIHKLNIVDIYKYQTITFQFVLDYILNEKYQKMSDEKQITMDDVLLWNPSLKLDFENFISSN